MIIQKSKAYRCILDLSFQLYLKTKLYTKKKAKAEGMVQIGLALWRLIATMEDHHDLKLPFLFSKLDFKDIFWIMAISNEDAWNFCLVPPFLTPVDSSNDIKIVVPNSLQMDGVPQERIRIVNP